MKNAFIVLAIVSAFIFTGCPKNDNPTGATTGGGDPGGGGCTYPAYTSALDSGLCFTTGGDLGWAVTTSPVYKGSEAMASGAITHSQSSWIETVVTGPGVLRYRMKVSGEYYSGFGDILRVTRNGSYETQIGSIDSAWVPVSSTVEAGDFTFRWTYQKDSSNSLGSDKAWLDDVTFTTAVPTPVIKPWGVTTTAAGWGQRSDFGSCVHNPGSGSLMYVVGGAEYGLGGQEDVWATADGAAWTKITATPPFGGKWGHTVTTHKPVSWPAEAIYVIAGYTQSGGLPTGGSSDSSDVWASGNGVDWVLMTGCVNASQFSNRRHTAAVSFNNKLWIIGGYNGGYLRDVWYSDDGSAWGCSTTAAAFTGRYGHTLTVFNNKMWVIGGFDGGSGTSLTNDVWFSTDGANWTRAAENAGFYARSQHQCVVYDNKMWIIGGSGTGCQEVWYTTDGYVWTYAPQPEWATRNRFGAQVFNNGTGEKIWVFGGNCGQGTYGSCAFRYSDVWYTEKN